VTIVNESSSMEGWGGEAGGESEGLGAIPPAKRLHRTDTHGITRKKRHSASLTTIFWSTWGHGDWLWGDEAARYK